MKFPWRIVGGCVGVMVVLAGANAGWSAWDSARRVERIRAKLDVVRKLGWATHPSELPTPKVVGVNAYDQVSRFLPGPNRTDEMGLKGARFELFLSKDDAGLLKSIVVSRKEPLDGIATAMRASGEFSIVGPRAGELPDPFATTIPIKTLCYWILAAVVVDVREGKLEAAKEKLGWNHRVVQSLFRRPERTDWLSASTVLGMERQYLLMLLNQGEPVEGLIEFHADAVAKLELDPSLIAQGELLQMISIPRDGDIPAAQREKWERKVREFLKLEDPKDDNYLERQGAGYMPKYPKMQRMMERLLDEWIVLGPKTSGWSSAFETREKIDLINDHVWTQIPDIAGDDWEYSTEESRRRNARLLEKPLVQGSMVRAFLEAWKFRRLKGRWPSAGELLLKVDSRYPGARFEFSSSSEGFLIDSDSMASSSEPEVALRYPPKLGGKISSGQAEMRQMALAHLGLGKAPAVPGGPPAVPSGGG
ncbi:MAG: hypothetical protein WCK51_09440 [Armatimonadota bacterium]